MVIDPRFIERIFSEIENHVALLHQVRAESLDSLARDPLRALGVQHALQIAIEGVLTISHHVIAYDNLQSPEKNADTVATLLHHGVLSDRELAERLPRMIAFRNLMVHRYWKVELEQIQRIIQNNLGDFGLFCSQIQDYLDRRQSSGGLATPENRSNPTE